MTVVVKGGVDVCCEWCCEWSHEYLKGSREDDRVGGVDPRLAYHRCNGLNKGHHSQGPRGPLPPEGSQQQHRPVAP